MTDKAKLGILSPPSRSVVFDHDGSFSGTGHSDIDVLRLGVDAVFDKFFDDACGALDDFASRNKIGQLCAPNMNK